MKQKLLLLLAILLAFGTPIAAQNGSEFAGGSGTTDDPWQIKTAAQLAALNNYLGSSHSDKHFKITRDIDLMDWLSQNQAGGNNDEKDKGWWPVGRWETSYEECFFGHIDGDWHTVSGLWIDREDGDHVGLFGNMRGGKVSNLMVEIAEKGIKGKDYVGGLIGLSRYPITHCHVSGTGTVSGTNNVGGLIGRSNNDISYCSSTVAVEGDGRSGGLIGYMEGNTILQSYSTGSVTVTGDSNEAGGLIGFLSGGIITQCYATGDVIENETIDEGIGGLVGAVGSYGGVITQSYATGTLTGKNGYTGGLAGYIYQDATLTFKNCFYRKEMFSGDPIYGSKGNNVTVNGEATSVLCQTEEALQTASTFTGSGWGFTDTWDIIKNTSYPFLQATGPFAYGTGTDDDPYLVYTPTHLNNVRRYPDKSFRQMKDIDLTDWISNNSDQDIKDNGWMPIGDGNDISTAFYGTFDGQGYRITGLWIDREERDEVGLFGIVDNYGVLKDVRLVLASPGVKGFWYVGGLVGGFQGTITSCSVEGDGCGVAGTEFVGGLTGYSYGSIVNSYTACTVATTEELAEIGGFTGRNEGSIENSYSIGKVTGGNNTGGLAGLNLGLINNSYAIGAMTATGKEAFAGGLTGVIFKDEEDKITSCYFLREGKTNQGLLGVGGDYDEDTRDLTPYTNDTYPEHLITHAAPLTVAQMMTEASYTGWEFITDPDDVDEQENKVWMINEGVTSPYLWWQTGNLPVPVAERLDESAIHHTVTLTVAPGIWCDYRAGDLTIADGGHLYLQFHTEDITLSADDILFLVDGAETAFKVSDDGRSGSYILNPVTKDHTIVIAQKEYTVTMPEVDGAVTDPAAGVHKASYGEPFRFTVSLNALKALNALNDFKDLKVYANDTELTPRETGQAQSLEFTIDAVEGPIDIRIEGINPTGNAGIAAGKISVATRNGQLTIDNSGQAVDVTIYNITGKNVVSLRALCGSKSIPLPAGIYIVQAGTEVYKVVVN